MPRYNSSNVPTVPILAPLSASNSIVSSVKFLCAALSLVPSVMFHIVVFS